MVHAPPPEAPEDSLKEAPMVTIPAATPNPVATAGQYVVVVEDDEEICSNSIWRSNK